MSTLVALTDGMDMTGSSTTIEDLIDDLAFLDDWESRYEMVIGMGKAMAPLAEHERSDANKVQGCASQVWLVTEVGSETPPVLTFRGESDAAIVQGLIAILLIVYSGKPAKDILAIDIRDIFSRLGLEEHLSSQRSNGFFSMVQRIRNDATAALETNNGTSTPQ